MLSVKIHVLKPFKLNVLDVHTSYGVGVHDVPEDVANHWYVKAHSEPVAGGVEFPQVARVDRSAEMAAALAEFEQYEPDLPDDGPESQPSDDPSAPPPKRRGRPPKDK